LDIDEPLIRIKTDGSVRHYVLDALDSVIALTDDSGVIKTTYSYDPFGNTTVSGETSDNPFQYTGRENDGTGLYYYRARYYSPELQRFASEDPIELWGGDVNFYAYVWNNPVNLVDPDGLATKKSKKKICKYLGKIKKCGRILVLICELLVGEEGPKPPPGPPPKPPRRERPKD